MNFKKLQFNNASYHFCYNKINKCKKAFACIILAQSLYLTLKFINHNQHFLIAADIVDIQTHFAIFLCKMFHSFPAKIFPMLATLTACLGITSNLSCAAREQLWNLGSFLFYVSFIFSSSIFLQKSSAF